MVRKDEVTFEIVEQIGVISTNGSWSKEINLVSWNGAAPKYDIRDWDESYERMTRGITLTENQARNLYEILKERFE